MRYCSTISIQQTLLHDHLLALVVYMLIASTIQVGHAQSIPAIDSLVEHGRILRFTNHDSSMVYLREAYTQSVARDYYFGRMKAQQIMAEVFYHRGEPDSAHYYVEHALELSLARADARETGTNYNILGRQYSENGQYGLSARHNANALHYYRIANDTTGMIYALWDMGWAYSQRDMLDTAMVQISEGLRLAEASGNSKLIGSLLNSIATIHKRMGNYEKSLEIYLQGIRADQEGGYSSALLAGYNNVGILYKAMKEYDSALRYYTLADSLANALHNERGVMSVSVNRGIVLNLLGRYAEAEQEFQRGIALATKYDIPISLADAKNGLSTSLYHQNRNAEALRTIKESIALARQVSSLEKEAEAHAVAKEIYLRLGDPQQAVTEMELQQAIRDSMFQIAKARQIDELQTQYETEKKDAEILLLNKNVEVESAKQRVTLWLSLFIIAIALGTIFSLYLSRKKQRVILTKERQLEEEKRRNAEIELEFKKKELTAKALQLASKNAFLHNLDQEISTLRHSKDKDTSTASARITRMIRNDTVDEEEWDQFSKEFGSLHQDFIESLVSAHGSFTNMELRLIALLKMNLSTKDIANILRISPDGVKKSRYRLRKKMQLDSDVNLQAYLLSK